MSTFHLKVLTVDRVFFDGDVDRVVVRTTQGDTGILPRHVKYRTSVRIHNNGIHSFRIGSFVL